MRYLPLLALALGLAGCDIEDFDGRRVEESVHETRALKQGGRVTVENFNGSVEVTGWEKDQVEINGTKYASNQNLLSMMKLEVSNTSDSVRIRVIKPDYRFGNMGAKLTIQVPRKVELERIQTSNGSLRATDIEGPVRMRTSNGAVRVGKVTGAVDITTSNGAIDVRELRGGATLQTSNGSIEARLDGALTNPLRAKTSNGSVVLRLPGSINAELRASTSNSSITTDFDLKTHGGSISKRQISGTIGTGGPSIDVSTSNGSIKVLKL